MSRPIVEMTGPQLVGHVVRKKPFDDPDSSEAKYTFTEFYHYGSAMRQAGRSQRVAAKNPNEKPVPFVMPSERYRDNYFAAYMAGLPPTYIVTSSVHLAGSMDHDSSTASYLNINNSIVIRDTTFNESFSISYLLSEYDITFEDCNFKGTVSIINSKFNSISFLNCDGIEIISVSNINATILEIRKSIFKEISIFIQRDEPYFSFNIVQNDIERKIDQIVIDSCKSEGFSLKGKNIVDVTYKNNEFSNPDISLTCKYLRIRGDNKFWIRALDITMDIDKSNEVSIVENLNIGALTINGILKKDHAVTFKKLNLNNLIIENLTNEGKLNLLNINVSNSSSFSNSDLGKTYFINTSFHSVEGFTINTSNIIDIITHDTTFPLNINVLNTERNAILNRKEVYRHLKNAASKQSDRYSELKYEAVEMELLKEILKRENKFDSFLFFINYHTNRHGQDWFRALCYLLGIALVSFTIIQWALGYTEYNSTAIPESIGNYFSFLNPVHRIWDVFKKGNSQFRDGIALAIDAGFRIVAGYLIFQLVRASRKYFK